MPLLRTGTIPDDIAARLQTAILERRFAAGSRLPPQRELARQVGVSRASLREAIAMLETLGFVKTVPGKGVFVTEHTSPDVPSLSSGAIARTYQLRYALEPFVAALVAMTASDDLIADLAALQDGMQEAMTRMDLVQVARLDCEFHRRIINASENPMFIEALRPVMGLFLESQRLPFANRGVVDAAMDEHARIVQQIRAHSPSGASEAMQRHILGAAHRTGNLFLRP